MTTLFLRPGVDPDALEVIKNYYLRYYDADKSNLQEALDSIETGLKDLKAFLVAVGSPLKYQMYYQALMEVLEDPVHPTFYGLIAIKNPYVLVAIAIGVEANMMSIRTGTQPFKGVDFYQFNGDEEEVIIAPPLTDPSPERLQELSDRFKRLTKKDLPKGDASTVITFVFNKLRIPIKAQPGKPVVFNLRKFLDTLAMLFVGQSNENLRAKPPRSFYDMTSHLNPNEWSPNCAARMTHDHLPFLCSTRVNPLKCDPVPPRYVAYPEVARDMCNLFTQSGNPTYPSWLKDMLAKDKEKGGDYDGDAPRQPSDDLLADSSDRQIPDPKPHPTVGHTISTPPNAERPRAEDAERPSSEPNSLEQLTASEYNANKTKSHESPASLRSSNPASDEERFAALGGMVHSVHTNVSACKAELKSLTVNELRDVSSETEAAPSNVGATTRPVVSNPDDEHMEDREEAPAETETGLAHNHDNIAEIIVFLVEIILLLGYVLGSDF